MNIESCKIDDKDKDEKDFKQIKYKIYFIRCTN